MVLHIYLIEIIRRQELTNQQCKSEEAHHGAIATNTGGDVHHGRSSAGFSLTEKTQGRHARVPLAGQSAPCARGSSGDKLVATDWGRALASDLQDSQFIRAARYPGGWQPRAAHRPKILLFVCLRTMPRGGP